MVASIFSWQGDILPFFAVGVESLIGQTNHDFTPDVCEWN